MWNLPRNSHRFLVEAISENTHIKKLLIKRFLQFTRQILDSPKKAIKNIYKLIREDCQSVTGSNLRNIMLLVNKHSVLDLVPDDALLVPYYEIPENQLWRKEMVNEITEAKFGNLAIEGFTTKELNVILEYVCTS